MIVTRRRRKPFPWRRLILPVVAIALVVFAFTWAPSRSIITGGPLGPAMSQAGNEFNIIARPFHFAVQNQIIADRNHQIVTLQQQLTAAQSLNTAKDKQIADLNKQIGDLQTQLASANSAPAPSAAPAAASQSSAASATAGAAQTSTQGTDDARTAQYWGNMEPENAAKVVQKLPVPYVARVLSQMSPDAVGAILDALPATYAARLTQENPQLKR